jgi:predicted metal-dependent phosphoesterase TrpH
VAALSDHDTTEGVAAFCAAAGPEVRVIPAIELTCRVRKGPLGTVHVLGYGVDPDAPALAEAGRRNRAGKRRQVSQILDHLRREERLDLPWDEVAGQRGDDAYVGRHHVAAVLVRRGVVKNRQKAFRRYLQSKRVPEVEVVSGEEALAAIHAAGGVSVLAHPNALDIDHHLRPLVRQGLMGVEVYRPRVGPRRQAKLEALAAKHELLVTGGSDWHGHHPEGPLGAWRPPAEPLGPALARLAG